MNRLLFRLIKKKQEFERNHEKCCKMIHQKFYFLLFSVLVTVFQYLIFMYLPMILGKELAGVKFMVLERKLRLFHVDFSWCLLGYNIRYDEAGNVLIGGGLGYFISYEIGAFLAQCINFPLQRRYTFQSQGNAAYQAACYFAAWLLISVICNGLNNLWIPIASAYIDPVVYNLIVTFVTGGVSMVIFFFVFKRIFEKIK